MRITAVRVGGAVAPLADVLADVTIHHGRASITDNADASSAQLTLLGVDRSHTSTFTVGTSLELDTDTAGRRFTGTITDAQLDDDRLTVLAIGSLAEWGRKKLPAGWTAPAEPWEARVSRLIQLAGMFRTGIPIAASEWYTVASANMGSDTLNTFWNFPGATPAWSYAVPDAGGRGTFPLVGGERYRLRCPMLFTPNNQDFLMVIDSIGGQSLGMLWPANLPFTWDFVSPASAPDARLVVYSQADIPGGAGHWAAWQQIIIERLPGYAVIPDPEWNPTLAAVDGTQGESTLADELAAVADDVGALVCDLPDGRIMVQAIGGRALSGAKAIDPAHVLYAPPWIQTDEVANVITVKWAGGDVVTSDPGSIGIYDERPDVLETTLANVSDANRRASERLARQAYARWWMPGCPLLVGYPLELGGAVHITALPAAAPAREWFPIVEGWTDSIVGDEWTMDVALSDPFSSGVALAWQAAAGTWATINQATVWKDALSPESLEP